MSENITTTERILAEMFTENTGRHMLDSGGAYGRNWERNAGKTAVHFRSQPDISVKPDYIERNTFKYLTNNLSYDADSQRAMTRFSNRKDRENISYYEDAIDFAEAHHDATWGDDLQPFNTYNWDNILDEVLQGVEYTGEDGRRRVALQYHGGCDVRGGYTRPRIFFVESDETLFLDTDNVELWCNDCEGSSFTSYGNELGDLEGNCWTFDDVFGPEWVTQDHSVEGYVGYVACPCCGEAMSVDASDL